MFTAYMMYPVTYTTFPADYKLIFVRGLQYVRCENLIYLYRQICLLQFIISPLEATSSRRAAVVDSPTTPPKNVTRSTYPCLRHIDIAIDWK